MPITMKRELLLWAGISAAVVALASTSARLGVDQLARHGSDENKLAD